MSENFYDGSWRPVLDMSDKALWKLRDLGFEFGADGAGHMMARWPIEPARTALVLSGISLEYWCEEVRLGCVVSLARLRRICAERGADYERTVEGLR